LDNLEIYIPLLRSQAVPLLEESGKVVGAEVLKSASNIANDAILGNNVKDSVKEHLSGSLNRLTEKANQSLFQKGNGYKRVNKRKRNFHNILTKTFKHKILIDVFDK
jgi:hypothetical protein